MINNSKFNTASSKSYNPHHVMRDLGDCFSRTLSRCSFVATDQDLAAGSTEPRELTRDRSHLRATDLLKVFVTQLTVDELNVLNRWCRQLHVTATRSDGGLVTVEATFQLSACMSDVTVQSNTTTGFYRVDAVFRPQKLGREGFEKEGAAVPFSSVVLQRVITRVTHALARRGVYRNSRSDVSSPTSLVALLYRLDQSSLQSVVDGLNELGENGAGHFELVTGKTMLPAPQGSTNKLHVWEIFYFYKEGGGFCVKRFSTDPYEPRDARLPTNIRQNNRSIKNMERIGMAHTYYNVNLLK